MRSTQHHPLSFYRQRVSTVHTTWYIGLSISVVVILWTVISLSGYIHPRTLPPPHDVVRTLIGLIAGEQTDFTYYAFSRTQTLTAHIRDTSLRLGISVLVGGVCGVFIGSLGAVYLSLSGIVSAWAIIYLSGFPRLVEILYLNHLGLIGHSAPIILGTLSVLCCVALSTKHALKDESLRDQVEHARLDAPLYAILIAIVIPQKRWQIATGWWLGTASALSLTYFCEYMQSTSGVGYLLQIAFSGDVRIKEALALTFVGMGILGCACGLVYVLAKYTPEGMVCTLYRLLPRPRR